MHVAEVDCQLRRQRPGRKLCQRDAFFVVAIGNPSPPLDQIAVHIAGQRDGPAKAEGTQAEEIEHELPERIGRPFRDFRRCHAGLLRVTHNGS